MLHKRAKILNFGLFLILLTQALMPNTYQYFCPECYEELSNKGEVVFNVSRGNGDELKLFLNPTPKTYNYRSEPPVEFHHGELVEFFCPHCSLTLESPRKNNFVEIDLKVNEKEKIEVSFSRVFGERKTFVGFKDLENEFTNQIKDK